MPLVHVLPSSSEHLLSICAAFAKARKVAILAGAGISTSAGIPDFRSENGIYSLIQAAYDNTTEAGGIWAAGSPAESSRASSRDGGSAKSSRRTSVDHGELQKLQEGHQDRAEAVVTLGEPYEDTVEGGVEKKTDLDVSTVQDEVTTLAASTTGPPPFVLPTVQTPQAPKVTVPMHALGSSLAFPASSSPLSDLSPSAFGPAPPISGLAPPGLGLNTQFAVSSPLSSLPSLLSSSPLSSAPTTLETFDHDTTDSVPETPSRESQTSRSATTEPDDSQSSAGSYSKRSRRLMPRNLKGRDLFDHSVLKDPKGIQVFYSFTTELRQRVTKAEPTATHHFITKLRDQGKLLRCYSQNIDLLEEKAGLTSDVKLGAGDRARFSKARLARTKSNMTVNSDDGGDVAAANITLGQDQAQGEETGPCPEPEKENIAVQAEATEVGVKSAAIISTTADQAPAAATANEPTSTPSEAPARASSRRRSESPPRSGVECVYLHGSLRSLRCILCGNLSNWELYGRLERTLSGGQPECPDCWDRQREREMAGKRVRGVGRLRPDIVLYGEDHPNNTLIDTVIQHDAATGPDLLLIMGTSLRVDGAKMLVKEFAREVHRRKGIVVLVNLTKPAESVWGGLIDYWVEMDCDGWVADLDVRAAELSRRPTRRRRETDGGDAAPSGSQKRQAEEGGTTAVARSRKRKAATDEGPEGAEPKSKPPPAKKRRQSGKKEKKEETQQNPAEAGDGDAPKPKVVGRPAAVREHKANGAFLTLEVFRHLSDATGQPQRWPLLPSPPESDAAPTKKTREKKKAILADKNDDDNESSIVVAENQPASDSKEPVAPRRTTRSARSQKPKPLSAPRDAAINSSSNNSPLALPEAAAFVPNASPHPMPATPLQNNHSSFAAYPSLPPSSAVSASIETAAPADDSSVLSAVRLNPRKRKAKVFFDESTLLSSGGRSNRSLSQHRGGLVGNAAGQTMASSPLVNSSAKRLKRAHRPDAWSSPGIPEDVDAAAFIVTGVTQHLRRLATKQEAEASRGDRDATIDLDHQQHRSAEEAVAPQPDQRDPTPELPPLPRARLPPVATWGPPAKVTPIMPPVIPALTDVTRGLIIPKKPTRLRKRSSVRGTKSEARKSGLGAEQPQQQPDTGNTTMGTSTVHVAAHEAAVGHRENLARQVDDLTALARAARDQDAPPTAQPGSRQQPALQVDRNQPTDWSRNAFEPNATSFPPRMPQVQGESRPGVDHGPRPGSWHNAPTFGLPPGWTFDDAGHYHPHHAFGQHYPYILPRPAAHPHDAVLAMPNAYSTKPAEAAPGSQSYHPQPQPFHPDVAPAHGYYASARLAPPDGIGQAAPQGRPQPQQYGEAPTTVANEVDAFGAEDAQHSGAASLQPQVAMQPGATESTAEAQPTKPKRQYKKRKSVKQRLEEMAQREQQVQMEQQARMEQQVQQQPDAMQQQHQQHRLNTPLAEAPPEVQQSPQHHSQQPQSHPDQQARPQQQQLPKPPHHNHSPKEWVSPTPATPTPSQQLLDEEDRAVASALVDLGSGRR